MGYPLLPFVCVLSNAIIFDTLLSALKIFFARKLAISTVLIPLSLAFRVYITQTSECA